MSRCIFWTLRSPLNPTGTRFHCTFQRAVVVIDSCDSVVPDDNDVLSADVAAAWVLATVAVTRSRGFPLLSPTVRVSRNRHLAGVAGERKVRCVRVRRRKRRDDRRKPIDTIVPCGRRAILYITLLLKIAANAARSRCKYARRVAIRSWNLHSTHMENIYD